MVTILMDNGVDPCLADSNSLNAVHWAARRGHGDMVTILVDNEVDPSNADMNGMNALHWESGWV